MSDSVTIELPADPMREAIAQVERDHRRIVLMRDGAPVAAIVPVEDLRALREMDALEDAHWSRVAEDAVAQWEAEGRPPGIPIDDIVHELGLDPIDPR